MDVWDVIWQGLLAGVIVGPLARLVMPGKQNMPLVMTVLIGAVGAIGGGLIYTELLNMGETSGIDWTRLIIQVAVAALLVVIFGNMANRRSTAT
ncbi:MAG TPA: GlsB/YeaQ/YmgE family stress response membrane protein [Acidimicrobiia bacterium]